MKTILLVLAVIVVILIIVKILTHKLLNDIDGFYGVHEENLNDSDESVIGSFGDDK